MILAINIYSMHKILLLLSVFLLSSYDGGGGHEDSGVKKGYFRDSVAKDISYVTNTYQGTTDVNRYLQISKM